MIEEQSGIQTFYRYLSCSQVYPTVLRSVGVGTCAGVARFGAMLTPYIAQVEDTCPWHVPRVLTPRAQVLMKQSFPAAVAVYVVCSLVSTVCCLLLPIETRGRDMRDKQ